MLLPKFSIRLLLFLMVGVAVFATSVTYAMRGNLWLLGIAAGLGSLVVVALMYAVFFLLFSFLSKILPRRRLAEPSQPPAPRPPLPESPR